MRESQSSSLGLEGALLIAHPNLLDPNFRRTVLFIVSHDGEEGALGVVLNRALGKTVADLLPTPGLGPLGHIPVFLGGPVNTDRMSFATFHWARESQKVECRINVDLEEAKELALDSEIVVRA
ncbi:MAG: YqgE/AlgH family protein, partial [Verrucomicrobiota bacterium]